MFHLLEWSLIDDVLAGDNPPVDASEIRMV